MNHLFKATITGRHTMFQTLRYALPICLCLVLALPTPSRADAATDAVIDEIMALSGYRQRVINTAVLSTRRGVFQSAEARAMPQRAMVILNEAISEDVREVFADPELWAGARRAYEATFTSAELNDLLDFYRTDAGRKLALNAQSIDAAMVEHMRPRLAAHEGRGSIMARAIPRLLEEGLITEAQAAQMLPASND
jgi:hypothetical protein